MNAGKNVDVNLLGASPDSAMTSLTEREKGIQYITCHRQPTQSYKQRDNVLNTYSQNKYESVNFPHSRRASDGLVHSYINDVYSDRSGQGDVLRSTKLPDYKIDLEAESTTSSHLQRLYGRLEGPVSPPNGGGDLMSFRPKGH